MNAQAFIRDQMLPRKSTLQSFTSYGHSHRYHVMNAWDLFKTAYSCSLVHVYEMDTGLKTWKLAMLDANESTLALK